MKLLIASVGPVSDFAVRVDGGCPQPRQNRRANRQKERRDIPEKAKKGGYRWIPLSPVSSGILLFGSFVSVSANRVGIVFDEVNGGIHKLPKRIGSCRKETPEAKPNSLSSSKSLP